MNHNLANGMELWKGNGNTTTLLFSLKGLEILHQSIRGQVKSIVMEHFKTILFHKSGPANRQHTYKSSIKPRKKWIESEVEDLREMGVRNPKRRSQDREYLVSNFR